MAIVAAVQMASTRDVQHNVEMASQFIEQAANKGAKCVVFPEEFSTLGLTAVQKRQVMESFEKGPIQQQLKAAAKKNKIWVIGGTLLIKDHDEKPTSSTLVWNSEGECVARYDKIHLFDVTVEAKEEYRESDNIKPGNKIVVLPTPFGKIGFAICYDLRFPELFRALMLKGAQVIVLPSAFTIQTGKAHWETLIRARAIENLCYMVAPGEIGLRHDGRGTYGHSMIVGPWGDILAFNDNESGVITADIDLEKMKELRKQFPTIKHYQPFVMQDLVNEVKDE